MLNTCFAVIGRARSHLYHCFLAVLRDDLYFAIHQRHDDIVHFVAMPAGGGAPREMPFRRAVDGWQNKDRLP